MSCNGQGILYLVLAPLQRVRFVGAEFYKALAGDRWVAAGDDAGAHWHVCMQVIGNIYIVCMQVIGNIYYIYNGFCISTTYPSQQEGWREQGEG